MQDDEASDRWEGMERFLDVRGYLIARKPTYTTKLPQDPGFYVIRFQIDGETKYAMIDWRAFKIEDGKWSVDNPMVHDLDKPGTVWRLDGIPIEFGAKVGL